MRPTRLLHVTAVEFVARRLLLPQLAAMSDAGYDVRLACAPEGPKFDPALRPFRPRAITFPRRPAPGAISAARQLGGLVAELRPDVVHFHSPAAAIPGRFSVALPKTRHPKIVYTVHGFLHQWDHKGPATRALAGAERFLSRLTDLSLFQSWEDLGQARLRGHGGLLRYLGNGVQDEWFTAPRSQERSDYPLRAVYVGRLTRGKGVLDLLSAVQCVEGVELTLIGAELPSDRDGVTKQAQRHPAVLSGRATFTGMREPTSIRAMLARAHLFVLPSWREGVPRSVIEAMATGLPILATSIRGCRELVGSGVNGWLVPPRQPTALAEALRSVVALPRAELAAMGRASFDKASGQFRESAVLDRLFRAYDELGARP